MSFSSAAAPVMNSTDGVRTPTGATVIDANTVVDGAVSTSHDLRVEGRLTGTVTCNGVIHVAQGAELDATVEAAGIVVAGVLSGTITCHGRLEIRSTGVVRGRVETGRLIVVEGAVYEGQLRMDAPSAEQTQPPVETPTEDTPPPTPPQATGSYSFLRSFTPGSPTARPDDDVLPGLPDDEEPG